jgi:hypothetical protein
MAVQCTEPLSSTSGKPFPTLFISILLQGSHCSEGCAVASQRVSKYPFNKGSWDINALFSTSSSKLNHTLQWDFNDLMTCMYHTSHIYIYVLFVYIYICMARHTQDSHYNHLLFNQGHPVFHGSRVSAFSIRDVKAFIIYSPLFSNRNIMTRLVFQNPQEHVRPDNLPSAVPHARSGSRKRPLDQGTDTPERREEDSERYPNPNA